MASIVFYVVLFTLSLGLTFTTETMQNYRSLEAYTYFEAGWVGPVRHTWVA